MLPRATENTVVGYMRPAGLYLDHIVLDNIKMAKAVVEKKKSIFKKLKKYEKYLEMQRKQMKNYRPK